MRGGLDEKSYKVSFNICNNYVLRIPVFAAMEEKLGNHWSKNMINKDFYFIIFPI